MVRPIRPSEVQKKRNVHTGIRINNSKVRRSHFYFSTRQIVLITVMCILFMGSGISYVWSNFEGTQIGFDLSQLQQDELRLKELNRKLKVELATLKSPQNLEAAARVLGLKDALPEQIVVLP
jgi:cell division protein FtsL